MQENHILMLKKELLLSDSSKKKPMMRFEIQSSSAIKNYLTVTLNDGTNAKAIYANYDRNYLEGTLNSDIDMVNFDIHFSSFREDEICMNPEHPYYDKGQICIVYDKDLNEIARTTYPNNCGYFWVDHMPIRGLQYHNLISDGYGYVDTYPPQTITCRKIRNEVSMGESVDAQQRIIDDVKECETGYNCYCELLCNANYRSPISNIECRHLRGILRRLGSSERREYNINKCPLKHITKDGDRSMCNVPSLHRAFRYPLRDKKFIHNCRIYRKFRLYYRHRDFSIVTSREALYA